MKKKLYVTLIITLFSFIIGSAQDNGYSVRERTQILIGRIGARFIDLDKERIKSETEFTQQKSNYDYILTIKVEDKSLEESMRIKDELFKYARKNKISIEQYAKK
jgi:hypothetical protein